MLKERLREKQFYELFSNSVLATAELAIFWHFLFFLQDYILSVHVVNPKVKAIAKVTSSHTRVILIYIIWSGKDPQHESVSIAMFIRTVCMRLTSVHNEYTGYTLKHLLLRHMYNLRLPELCVTLLAGPLSLSANARLTSHCTLRCFI